MDGSPRGVGINRALRRLRAAIAVGWPAVLAAAVAAIALSRTWFYYDDFWNISVSREMGLTWAYLTRSVLGHFYPGYNLSFAAVRMAGTGGFPLGVALTVVGYAGLGFATAAVVRSLATMGSANRVDDAAPAGRYAPTLAAAAAVLFGAWAPVLLWLSAASNSVPAALFCVGMVWCHLRWLRDPRPRWAVLAALSFGCALSFYETAVIALVPLVALTLMWSTEPGVRGKWSTLIGQRRLWAAYAAPLAVLAVAFVAGPYGEDFTNPASPVEMLRLSAKSSLDGYGTAVVGLHPGHFDLFGSAVVSNVFAAVVLILLGLVLSRRRGVWGVAAVAVGPLVAFLRFLPVSWGRLHLLGWVMSHDPRYYADLAWVMPVMVAAAWFSTTKRMPPAPALVDARARFGAQWSVWRVPLGVTLATAAVVGHFAIAYQQSPQKITREYRDAVGADLAKFADQGRQVSILDTLVPAAVLGPEWGYYTHQSRVLPTAFSGLHFNDPYLPLFAPDFSGHLIPAQLTPAAAIGVDRPFPTTGSITATPATGGGTCWSAGSGGGRVWLPLDHALGRQFWVIRLEMAPGTKASKSLLIAGGSAPLQYVGVQSPVQWNAMRVLVTSNSFTADQLGIDITAHERICVRSGQVLQLAPPP